MDFDENEERHSLLAMSAFGVVIILHVGIGYAFFTGLGQKIIETHIKPVMTKIIEDIKPIEPVKIEPKPEPPKIKPIRKPPPISWAPKSEVQSPTPNDAGIKALTQETPPTNVMSLSTDQPNANGEITQAKISGQCEKPEYPRNSLRNGEEGIVDVKVTISAKGEVLNSEVTKSSGFKDLDRATVNAWTLCRFTPAIQNGKEVESTTILEYIWKIEK